MYELVHHTLVLASTRVLDKLVGTWIQEFPLHFNRINHPHGPRTDFIIILFLRYESY